jgi:hypothetical protein
MTKKYAIFVRDTGYEILYSFDTIEPMLDWLRLQHLAIEWSQDCPNDEPPTHLLPHLNFIEDWYGKEWYPKYPLFYGQEIYL